MIKPTALKRAHYECKSLDETVPVLTDLLAFEVVRQGPGQATVKHPNTDWELVVHEGDPEGRGQAAFASLRRAGGDAR